MELLARTCNTERMNVERIIARLFVISGGAFWAVAAMNADFVYNDKPLAESVGSAMLPLGIAAAALVLGWFFETLGGLFLFAGAAAVGVWGFVAEWEQGVWLVNATVLIAPMIVAGAMYLLAARMQNICTLEETASTT